MNKGIKLMKNTNSEKGITLIALVITIIVLLILAGVTVTTMLSKDGLLGMAKKTKEETEKTSIQREIDAAVDIAKRDNKTDSEINMKVLQKELEKLKSSKVIDSYEQSGEFSLPSIITKGNYRFKIDGEGNVNEILDSNSPMWRECETTDNS